MSVRRLADAALQPEGFKPTRETMAFAKAAVKKFPKGKQASAVIPLLWRVQEQNGWWVPEPALRRIRFMCFLASCQHHTSSLR